MRRLHDQCQYLRTNLVRSPDTRGVFVLLIFMVLLFVTLGLTSAAFAHGLDVSAKLSGPNSDGTAPGDGEPSGFVELQITEEIGEICWDIEFEGIDESADLVVRATSDNTSLDHGRQPPLVQIAPVTNGSADCVFRDIEATTEITLDVDAHLVELVSVTTGDVLLRGRLHKPLAPGFEASDASQPAVHNSTRPWKRVIAVAIGTGAAVALLANLMEKRSTRTS